MTFTHRMALSNPTIGFYNMTSATASKGNLVKISSNNKEILPPKLTFKVKRNFNEIGEMSMVSVIASILIKCLIFCVAIIIYLRTLFKGRRIIEWEKAPADMQKIIRSNEKKINTGIKILIGSVLLWISIFFLLPAGLDFLFILHNECPVVRGQAVSWDYSDEKDEKERVVRILSKDTGKEVDVIVYSEGIRKGDYLEVRYLPHTGYGEITLPVEEIKQDE